MLTKRERRREYAVLLLILALILGGCRGNRTAITETKPVVPEVTEVQQALPAHRLPRRRRRFPPQPNPRDGHVHPGAADRNPNHEADTHAYANARNTNRHFNAGGHRTPTPVPVDAMVTAPQLNVRSGPGTAFGTVATLVKDDVLDVIGQSNGCVWLQVRTATGAEGWVAHVIGSKEYTSLNIECDTVPEVVVPTPTPRPQPTSPPAVPTLPPAVATATPESELPPNLGCYLIQNQLGVEITVTINNGSFRVPPMMDFPLCLPPGRYNYTIDAPPPWNSINGTLEVVAGDRLLWPIRAQSSDTF